VWIGSAVLVNHQKESLVADENDKAWFGMK